MKLCKVITILFLVTITTPPGDAWLQSVWKGIQRDAKNLGLRLFDETKQFGTRVVQTVLTQSQQTVCQVACPKVCQDHIGKWLCPFVCNPVCPKTPKTGLGALGDTIARVKRSLVQGQHYQGHLMPLPNKFSAFDLNDDGVVSLNEMAAAGGSDVTDPGFQKAFSLSDVDGNGVLSPKELYEGPFVFEKDLGETDYLYCKYTMKKMKTKKNKMSAKDVISQIPRLTAKGTVQ